jgi:pimeloyl-ACP methyl ester carboxylesterase
MPHADLRGQHIRYEDTGGDGLPLVLSHGFLMDREMFAPQAAALGDQYRVITWDQRGHGETVFDGQAFDYWDLAEDLAALLDHLGVRRAVVGGMSAGGFISLRFALRHPERVLGLVLIDTQAGLEDPANVPAYDSMHEIWRDSGPNDQLLEMTSAIILGDYPEAPAWIAKWRARPHDELTPTYRCLMDRDDITGRLGEITAPAIVLHGEVDAAIPLERAQALCAGLPGCRQDVVVVPGGGHAANLSNPPFATAAIVQLLAQVPQPA